MALLFVIAVVPIVSPVGRVFQFGHSKNSASSS